MLFIAAMLAVDLGLFNRKEHVVSVREALVWSAVWISLALIFNAFVYFWRGPEIALQFFTGYVLEKSLSVDNIFVFIQVFVFFGIPALYQHKILFWGVLGAIIMRALFIFIGVALITKFHWIIYVFGAFLIFTGVKMAIAKEEEVHPEKNILIRILKKFMPVTSELEDGKFVVRKNKMIYATPLLVVLLVIETTDVIFAVDSIPAVLAITTDPFIVFSSNLFAIMGLRSLFFALAGAIKKFYYIHYGLAGILTFVGIKMLIADYYKLPSSIALGIVGAFLLLSMLASIIWPNKNNVDADNAF